MIYEIRVTAPPSTVADEAVETITRVSPGTLEQIEIQFPSGCAGLVHCQILYQDVQAWPSNLDQDFSGDGAHLVFRESLPLLKSPQDITVRLWNEDDTFHHTVTVRLTIIKPVSDEIHNLDWLNSKG